MSWKDDAYDLRKIFEEIEIELIESMKRTLKLHEAEEENEGFRWEQWQRAKLRNLREYRKRNSKIIMEQSPAIKKLVEQTLEEGFKDGRNRVNTLLGKMADQYKPSFPKDISDRGLDTTELKEKDFFGINEKKIETLQEVAEPFRPEGKEKELSGNQEQRLEQLTGKVSKDMKSVQSAVLRGMDDVYRKTIYRAEMHMTAGAKTLDQAIDMATKEFLEKGINCIEYRDGKRVNIASYAEMALRTASHRATLLGEGKKRDEWSIHTVVVSAHANTCPDCERWQGNILIDDVFSSGTLEEALEGGYYLLSFAIKSKFLHPNCRHSISTYFPGISSLPTIPDGKAVVERYEAEQVQRKLERLVRKQKRIAAGAMEETAVIDANKKIRQLQSDIREHLEKYPYLRRAYRREKIYEESTK